jgi:hypothetical protein
MVLAFVDERRERREKLENVKAALAGGKTKRKTVIELLKSYDLTPEHSDEEASDDDVLGFEDVLAMFKGANTGLPELPSEERQRRQRIPVEKSGGGV